MTVFEHLGVEGVVADHHALIQPDLVCLEIDFEPGLLVELRRIR